MSDRILVVDDEKLIRWSLSTHLSRRGHDVQNAESGEEAVERVRAAHPDLMFLDVRLGGIDGIETLKRCLAIQPDLPVVMMSAHGTVGLAVEAMKLGATDFLLKPFPMQALDEMVTQALAGASGRRSIAHAVEAHGLVGQSGALEQIRNAIARLAASKSTVLIEGESGSGKEVVARAIHAASSRAAKLFVTVNCATLPDQLLESELFGHERGSFTDAREQKQGLFELADGGTVMLDEIGDLPAGGQAKLLRLLEDKRFRRVGGLVELASDVRVIAATHVDLEARVAEGRFRTDLFFRLNVVRMTVPPLREHRQDIPTLAAFFVARYNKETNGSARGVSPKALELMLSYPWPGNVRELRNAIERAFALHPGIDEIRPEHLPPALSGSPAAPLAKESGSAVGDVTLKQAERRMIQEAMAKAHDNQSQAARLLGVSRDTLRYRLKKLELG